MNIIILIIGIIVLFILYQIYEQNVLKVSKYKINLCNKKIKKLKIVQISDLHSKSFGKNNNRLINKINELNPDILLFTGDIIDRNQKNYICVKELLINLSQKYNTFYICGNHEMTARHIDLKKYLSDIKYSNVNVLLNEKISLDNNVDLYGINFYTKEYFKRRKKDYKKLLKDIDDSKLNIALIHDPIEVDELKKYNLDIIFSGHMHGGIVRVFKRGVFSPYGKLFPKYSGGNYKIDRLNLVISCGLGKSRALVRINNKPEIVLVEIN